MVAFDFKPRFAPLVEAGTKLQTIRRTAKAKPGDRLQLYTGQRTRACRKLVTPDPICTLVDYVGIRPDYLTFGNKARWPERKDEFAQMDGFKDYDDMLAWFTDTYGSPYFQGYVHSWAQRGL
jgi:hypothetical protein